MAGSRPAMTAVGVQRQKATRKFRSFFQAAALTSGADPLTKEDRWPLPNSAGTTIWDHARDPQDPQISSKAANGDGFYQIVVACQYLFVPQIDIVPSYQAPWSGQPLPTTPPVN